MSKLASFALPAVLAIGGTLLGGPLGASAGIGATAGGALGGAAGGALGSGITGGNPLVGAVGGGLGGLASGLSAGSSLASGPMSVVANSEDPIAALSNAMTVTGTNTASEAAAALGYSSTDAMLAAANPTWLNAGAAFSGAAQNIPGNILGRSTVATAGPGGASVPVNGNILSTMTGQRAAGLGTAASATGSGLGTAGSALSIGSGLYGLYNAYEMQQLANQSNPLAGYSKQYADQLAQLTSNPNSITSMPDYQAGLTAVERSQAAQGYSGSGNMAQALAQYGSSFYNQQVQQLAGLATLGQSGAATQMQGQLASANLASQSLGSLGYAARMGAI